jgi:hypothetical protein
MMRVLAAWPHAVHRPRPELAALVHLVAEQETGARRCQPAAGLERLVTVRPGCVTTPPLATPGRLTFTRRGQVRDPRQCQPSRPRARRLTAKGPGHRRGDVR